MLRADLKAPPNAVAAMPADREFSSAYPGVARRQFGGQRIYRLLGASGSTACRRPPIQTETLPGFRPGEPHCRLPAQYFAGAATITRRQGGRSRLRSRRASDRLRPGRGAACRDRAIPSRDRARPSLAPTASAWPPAWRQACRRAGYARGWDRGQKSSARLARPRTTSGGSGGTGKISANHLCHCTADRVRQNEDLGAPVQTAECSPRHCEIADDRRSRAHRGMRLSRASRAPVRRSNRG